MIIKITVNDNDFGFLMEAFARKIILDPYYISEETASLSRLCSVLTSVAKNCSISAVFNDSDSCSNKYPRFVTADIWKPAFFKLWMFFHIAVRDMPHKSAKSCPDTGLPEASRNRFKIKSFAFIYQMYFFLIR